MSTLGDRDAPVVVVGAGLAGLACAQRLSRSGVDVIVLEASDGVGGRVRTDVIDGFRCDRGFQLLNPAYPALATVVDPIALDLRAFGAGVVVAHGSQQFTLADPRREPGLLFGTLTAPLGGFADKVKFGRWAGGALLPVSRQLAAPDTTLAESLDRAGVTGPLRTGVVEPFLAGVLADWDGASSAQFAALLVRSFILGSPSVPSLGMGRLPELIAAGLQVRLGVAVHEVRGTAVRTSGGWQPARAVVVATDPATATELTGVGDATMKALTTFWHTAPEPPTRRPLLHLDADRRGPVVNTAVLTTVAPSYAPAGKPLIASTVVGAQPDAEPVVREQLARIYGVGTDRWELITRHVVAGALPAQPPPLRLRRPNEASNGTVVAGDHRDTASIQGALVSGRRAATTVLGRLGLSGSASA